MVTLFKSKMDEPTFDSPEEEASYWKQVAEDYVKKLQDAKDEFEEFQEGSHELEKELEVQLEQYEQKVTELMSTKEKLEEENHIIKEKLETLERDSYLQVTELQDENGKIKAVSDEMQRYIRELEQCNDDLERSKRATICSLEEFDTRLNNAIERNAFLENELEEKEKLIITVQRLKDESRDLKSELATNSKGRKTSLNESKLRLEETQSSSVDSNDIERKKLTPVSPKVVENVECNGKIMEANNIIYQRQSSQQNNASPMTPSARISALNIVSDLLRKVGALESKLARCRNFVQEHPHPHSNNSSSHKLFSTGSTDCAGLANDSSNNSLPESVKTNV